MIGDVVGGFTGADVGGLTGSRVGGRMGSNVDELAVSGVRLIDDGVVATGKPMVILAYTGTAVVSMELTLIMREFPVP